MTEYVLARIQAIQQKLETLRKAVMHQVEGPKRKTKLKGLWKGVFLNEAELTEAQYSVFKDSEGVRTVW